MRILAVTPYYEPEGGGLERYAHAMLRRLAARGHDVEVVCFTRDGRRDEVKDGVRVHRNLTGMRLGNSPISVAFLAELRRAMRHAHPDVVWTHTPVPFPAEMAGLAARREGIPYVVTYHAGRLRGSSPLLDAFAALDRATLERGLLAHAAHLVAVSPYVRDHALARHAHKTTVIPPGVDPERFSPAQAPTDHDILMVAPLSRRYHWKGLDVLWKAFPAIRRRIPDARLVLVGSGDRLHQMRMRAERMGGAVVVHPRVSDAELPDLYRKAAVVVLPSTTEAEAFGMVLAEANACGRPVVASRIGGIPDLVTDGQNGLLAKARDPADLAARIIKVLSEPDLASDLGRNGRQRIVRHHGWDDLTKRMEQVLENASHERAGAAVKADEPASMTA